MTTLSDLGEFGLIKRFSENFKIDVSKNITGIGDDCAIIPLNLKESLLVTTDMLIEDRHFLLNYISAFDLGYKSLAVNLSDIAAMGGTPHSAFLSLGLPSAIELEWIDEFFLGLQDLANSSHTLLLGGDTTKSPDKLVINISVIGKGINRKIKKRSAARPGDIICITDNVGDSAGGLKVILNDLFLDEDNQYLVHQHHHPFPKIEEGKWLAKQTGINAMIDISDGIESDIQRIMECSAVGAEIDVNKIPVSDILKKICLKYRWDINELSLSGGEDYCLMATIDPARIKDITNKFEEQFGRPLYIIGQITDKTENLVFKKENIIIHGLRHGFDHFKKT